MSYTELESGYQDLRQSTQQSSAQHHQQQHQQHSQSAQQQQTSSSSAAHSHRVGFYLGHDGNGDTDFGDSNDGMDSDTSNSSSNSKQVVVGICAMAKKTQSKPMKEILTRLGEFEFIKLVTFEEHVILREPVQNWPTCDCLVSFHSKGFPLEKAIEYAQLRNPFVLNNLHMQYDIQDRRRVYAILEKEGIEIPRYAVLDRDSPDPKHHELIESEDHVEVNGITFNKPFVEKPVSAEDHNIYIYYPTSAGGGSQRLFRKIGSRSSVYSPESRVRKTGSFIYEDFMPTDGTDVKVYTVGPDYAHAEARKSPALDGKVERDSEGKEIRYPVILNHSEKLISRKVCLAFKQTVCGFDLLRANGKSYVCDVNGFSFVKNSNKYYDDCAKILGNMILRELTPTLHIPWSVPFQLDDPPIVPTTFGKMMELRCVVAVIRHGDRTPKQKMKVEVRHPKFFEIFEKYDGYKLGHVKLKRPKQLQEILDIARFLLSEIHTKTHVEIEEKESKLEQLKNVLEMYGHFSGINRKVQMKYQPKGRPRGSSSDDADTPAEPSLVLILKWGGELTPAGRIQAEELGRIFRCMYPGGQGRSDYSGTQGLGLLRLHSTFRHDLKIYASDEGRVQMTAAAFAKGLLALEGELTPILVQMVKSANTNGLLDNDCDSSKYQNLAKGRLHELMQNDREFTSQDRELINPCNSKSINQALDFVKNPVDCCHHVLLLIRELLHIISIKKDDPKTKDAILYHGETWDLMRCRWEKIEKDFSTKSKLFDISKIPDIYDCIKYDLQHNQHTLQYDQAEELYIYAKNLADIVIPQEYGLTPQEKLAIGQGICSPLLRKIKGDLQRNIDEVEDEFMNRLNPHYSHGVASPQRHVRTRLYFTSESHVHSLLTVLRYGGLLNVVTDEQWRRAMDYISMVSELNYMSQIVIMLYEDPTKDPTSEERFHVELHFSPGVNCCVQKNLPPGPGFRPHSHSDNTCNVSVQSSEESNPSRIEEEIDIAEDTQSKKRCSLISNPRNSERISGISTERGYSSFTFNRLSSKQLKSKPIPIGAHHTVSGHEAMDLAKRLNEELASQQQLHHQQQHHTALDIRPISPDIRAVSPDCEPRSRSFEQRPTTTCGQDQDVQAPVPVPVPVPAPSPSPQPAVASFDEITSARVGGSNRSAIQIRVTDSLSFFKIDSSTNELPLSDIDFSQNPGTPQSAGGGLVGAHRCVATPHKRLHVLTMCRMESTDEPDYVNQLQHLPQISPLATNERPLTCQCTSGEALNAGTPHAHSKSMADLVACHTHAAPACGELQPSSAGQVVQPNAGSSFDDDFQLSSSAPAALLSCEFGQQPTRAVMLSVHCTTSPTASTLRLCKDMDESQLNKLHQEQAKFGASSAKATSHSCGQLSMVQSAPVVQENPFRFPSHSTTRQASTPLPAPAPPNYFVSTFAPIAEHVTLPSAASTIATTINTYTTTDTTTQPQVAYNLPTLLVTNIGLTASATPTAIATANATLVLASIATTITPTATATATTTTTTTAIITTTTTTAATTITTITIAAAAITNTATMSSNLPFTNQFNPIDPSNTDHRHHHPHRHHHNYNPHHNYNQHKPINHSLTTHITTNTPIDMNANNNNNNNHHNHTIYKNTTTATTTSLSCCTTTIATDSTVSASVSSANSSTSSRRQRHSIAGQMSYMKMLGFGGFSKKMATSANSLFSTAVISGSSSAPNLRDMIPVSSSGFGDVPPIRPLETLHNALSLRKLDSFLQDMIFAQIFKTPTGSPPRVVELPISTVSSMTLNQREEGTVPSILHRGPSILTCESCDRGGSEAGSNVDNVLRRTVGSIRPESAVENLESNYDLTKMAMAKKLLWQQQQQQDSLQSEEMAQEPLAKMPALSGVCSGLMPIVDIHTVDVDVEADLEATAEAELGAYAPMNQDTLDGGVFLSVCAGSASSDRDEKSSACLTPVSFGMDLSMVANKGSMTLSVDGFDDDEEATLSAGTTPSLPMDEPQLETCYCCPSHAGHMEPPDVEVDDPKFNFALTMPLAVPDTRVTHASPERVAVHAGAEAVDDDGGTFNKSNVRRAHDPISPRIQKQISLFESGGFECAGSSSGLKDNSALHASINLPAAGSSQLLRQDARLRKFENLTQSTSNSNFPFESNTLKRAPMPAKDYADVSHTQSCINLKSNAFACCSGAAVAAGGGGGGGCVGSQAGHGPESVSGVTTASVSSYSSPRHQAVAAHAAGVAAATHYRLCNALSACSSLDATPHPGALIVKECFIEPPKRIIRGYNGKTQSMDADFLFNEFLLLPAMASTLPHTSDGTNSGSNTPSTRFLTAKLSLDEPESPAYAAAAAAAAASSGPGSGSVPASQQQRK